MTRGVTLGVAAAIVLGVFLLLRLAGNPSVQSGAGLAAAGSPSVANPAAAPPPISPPAPPTIIGSALGDRRSEIFQDVIFGRVTTDEGATHVGRLRFGGGEEAFWGDYFNGSKKENPWAARVPAELLTVREPFEVFGVTLAVREGQIELRRPFMARFGDIARIESTNGDLTVTLKSGTVVPLDRLAADDFADGVRIWDEGGDVVDLEERQIRSIDLLSPPVSNTAPDRLHGTVKSRGGDEFTGFLQWNRQFSLGSDVLVGRAADQEVIRMRFDTIRSIARMSPSTTRVILIDGREIVLTGASNRGVYVDDRRYGRVLVSWNDLEQVDFGPGSGSPAYGDFPMGRPLTGSVTTRTGVRHTGRLVYDLDESETIETLDAPSLSADLTIFFGLIASIVLPDLGGPSPATVTLHSGEELHLRRQGDLIDRNVGILVFVDGRPSPEFVPWAAVARIDLDRPPEMYPPLDR